ncbi:MAG: tyrosine--tRNA ligase [Candidatus Competibacterales bacterium]
MSFLEELQWRGLLHQTAGAGVEHHLQTPRVGYCGFDPTKASLTIGNFIAIKLLMHWQRAGHTPIVLMGGGTGLIGDPSGKDAERQLLSREEVAANIAGQRRIFETLLDFSPSLSNRAIIVNNDDWLGRLGYIDVLRDIGKYFSVNAMIQKDSVRDRLHNREQGISYTEFSYMILQAYDFLHLYRHHGCTVQIAGSDQYGNITGGMDLIRRLAGEVTFEGEGGGEKLSCDGITNRAFGITNPLVTRSDGQKIGKTADGAIWLTADRTSPYRFYQYWINVEDVDVERFLRWFTFLDPQALAAVMEEQRAAPHLRPAQRTLAGHITQLLHGEGATAAVEQASQVLFGKGELRSLSPELLQDVFADVPHSEHPKDQLSGEGLALVDLLPATSLAESKRQAREFLANGAVAVNGERVEADTRLQAEQLLHGSWILLRRGKRHWHATRWR